MTNRQMARYFNLKYEYVQRIAQTTLPGTHFKHVVNREYDAEKVRAALLEDINRKMTRYAQIQRNLIIQKQNVENAGHEQ